MVGSITAEAFPDALFGKHASQLQQVFRFLRSRARVSIVVREGDTDGRSQRLVQHEQELCQGVLYSFAHCMVHQANTSVGAVVKQAQAQDIISGAYSYAKLLRMGNFFIRTLLSVELVVAPILVVHPTPPSPANVLLNEVMLDMFYMPSGSKGRRRGARPSKRRALQHELRNKYLMLCNGSPFGERLVHHCHPSVGRDCQGSRDALVRRIARILVAVLYSRRPVEPQQSEWSSIRESMAFLAFTVNANRLGAHVFEQSVSRGLAGDAHVEQYLAARSSALVPAAVVAETSVQPDVENLSWRTLAGNHINAVRAKIMQLAARLSIALLAVVIGALDFVTAPFFAKAVCLVDLVYMPF